MTGIKERFDNLYNYPVGEEPGTNYSGASDLYAGGMNKSLTGLLVSGGLALAGQGINYLANRETNQANREMQREANQHNIDLWRMQTEYNTPANQIARLRQANLNPNLIYGNPMNTAGAPPEMKASKNERYQLDPMTMANVMLMSKQMQNLEADNQVKQAEARNIDANTDLVKDKQDTEQELVRFVKAQADEKEKIVSNFQTEFDKRMKKLDETINLLKNQNKTEEQEYRKLFNENNWFAQTWADRRNILREELKRAGLLNKETQGNIDYMFTLTVGNRFANRLQQMLFDKSNDFALYGNRMSYYDLYVYSLGKDIYRREMVSQDSFGRYVNFEKKTLENRAWFDSTGYGTFLYGAGQTLDAFNVSFGITPFGMSFGSPAKIKGFGR